MYECGKKKGSVSFKVKTAAKAQKAALAGDWNNWQPVTMRKQKDGTFIVSVDIPPGRYEYKFVVDGSWVHDGDVPGVISNSYGTLNSVAYIK